MQFLLLVGLAILGLLLYLRRLAAERAHWIVANSKQRVVVRLVLLTPYSLLASFLPRIPYVNAFEIVKALDQIEEAFVQAKCDVIAYCSPFGSYIATRDASVSHHALLKHRADLIKPAEFYEVVNHYGPNIVSTEGPEWLKHRKAIQPSFSDEALRYTAVATSHYCNELIADLFASKGTPISVLPAIKGLTMKVICDSGFGYDLAADLSVAGRPTLLQSLTVIIDNMLLTLLVPKWIRSTIPLQLFKSVQSSFETFKFHVDNLIKSRKANPGKESRKDILTLMLLANDNGGALTDDDLVADSFIFLFAGHETSANTLTWTLAYLSYDLEVQEKLYARVVDVLGHDRDPTFDDYKDLSQVESAIKESLRLRGPVYDVFKRATRDIEVDGVAVPKGVLDSLKLAIFDIWSGCVQRYDKYWKDPLEFKPMRFADEAAGGQQFDSAGSTDTWFPFARGPRSCVGFRFALIEMTLALAMLIRKFRFHSVPGVTKEEALKYTITILLQPAHDIKVIAEERS